jgi:hypothetical protein
MIGSTVAQMKTNPDMSSSFSQMRGQDGASSDSAAANFAIARLDMSCL